MAKTKITMTLPKLGDRLLRVMIEDVTDPTVPCSPAPCTVTYVNDKHRWYQVTFDGSGVKECFTCPVFDHGIFNNISWKGGRTPVICNETGTVYSSMHECARDLGMTHGEISRQLSGERISCKGYHFSTVF